MSQDSTQSSGDSLYLKPDSYASLWRLSWPVLVGAGANTLFSLVDLYWVGSLGTTAIAAVSLCGNIIFSLMGLTVLIHTGALAMIARRIGAASYDGDDGVSVVSAQALQLSLFVGLLFGVGGYFLTSDILSLFNIEDGLHESSVQYLEPMILNLIFLCVNAGLGAIFMACGNPRIGMYVSIVFNIVNAILDPFLIFGWWIFPELGVQGAGLASLICGFLSCITFFILFSIYRFPFQRPRALANVGFGAWPTLLRVGIPSGLGALTRPFSTLFLLNIMAHFGEQGVAAYGISIRILSIVWLYHMALGAAVTTLTGQSLGRDDMPGLLRMVKMSLWLSFWISIALSIFYWIFAEESIALIEKENQEVIALGATFVQLLCFSNVTVAFSLIWGSVMTGAGETRPPMYIAIISNWVVKIPLSYYLAIPLEYGVYGIFWGMFISIVFEVLATWVAYRRDRWKTISV